MQLADTTGTETYLGQRDVFVEPAHTDNTQQKFQVYKTYVQSMKNDPYYAATSALLSEGSGGTPLVCNALLQANGVEKLAKQITRLPCVRRRCAVLKHLQKLLSSRTSSTLWPICSCAVSQGDNLRVSAFVTIDCCVACTIAQASRR